MPLLHPDRVQSDISVFYLPFMELFEYFKQLDHYFECIIYTHFLSALFHHLVTQRRALDRVDDEVGDATFAKYVH